MDFMLHHHFEGSIYYREALMRSNKLIHYLLARGTCYSVFYAPVYLQYHWFYQKLSRLNDGRAVKRLKAWSGFTAVFTNKIITLETALSIDFKHVIDQNHVESDLRQV